MKTTLQIGSFEVEKDFSLEKIPENRLVINTINAYSWTMTDKYPVFKKALQESDILLPDGVSIVWAARLLTGERIKKTAGADLHKILLENLQKTEGRCFYLGASNSTLERITHRIRLEYPSVEVATYSPPFKTVFSEEDNVEMHKVINEFKPDVVFVGMTAPKQEIWIHQNYQYIDTHILCGIGAVFDFYAETKKRPPRWMINCGLEWFGRLCMEPSRLWKRYLLYNAVFVWKIFQLYFKQCNK